MKQSVTVGAQLLWSGRYGCNNGCYGCTIVMSYIEINKAVSQWLLTFNLFVSVNWPLTCAFQIPCTHTSEIIDMHRGMCDNWEDIDIAHVIIIIKSEVSILPIIIFFRGCVPGLFVTSPLRAGCLLDVQSSQMTGMCIVMASLPYICHKKMHVDNSCCSRVCFREFYMFKHSPTNDDETNGFQTFVW